MVYALGQRGLSLIGRGAASVGLDIDRGALKAVQVSQSGGAYTLRHVGYRRLAPGAIAEGEVADHDLLASELKAFWSTHSFKGKSVYIGIANQKVVVRLLDLPKMSPEDLRGAISYQAQEHIAMPIEEAVLDHMVLGPAENGDLDRVLVVAAQRDMVNRYSSAVKAAGLNPVGVDVKALSLLRSTLPPSLFEEEVATLLLDISSEITSLVIVQGANPTLTRFIPGGADAFAQAVADAARMSTEEAEDAMMHLKLGSREEPGPDEASGPELPQEAQRGLEEAIRLLSEDIQRSIEYHNVQLGAREVSQVVLSGEGSMADGFEDYLGDLLAVPTFRGAPLQKFASNKSNVQDEQLKVMESVLAVAIGLALEEA